MECSNCGCMCINDIQNCNNCGHILEWAVVQFGDIRMSYKDKYQREEYVSNILSELCKLENGLEFFQQEISKIFKDNEDVFLYKIKLSKQKSKVHLYIPTFLGYKYEFNRAHVKYVRIINETYVKYYSGSRLNMYYVMHQIIKLEGGDTRQIPYSLKPITTSKLNNKWKLICHLLGLKYNKLIDQPIKEICDQNKKKICNPIIFTRLVGWVKKPTLTC